MYHYNLDVCVFSADRRLETALRDVPARERFEHSFATAGAVVPERLAACDVAILDLPTTPPVQELRGLCKAGAKLVLSVDADCPAETLERAYAVCDDVWRRPVDPALAAFRFGKLLDLLKLEKDLWLTENYLDTGIDSIPDLVWFKDVRGAHLKVNNAFCRAVGKTKEDIQGRGHYYIWDLKQEEYEKGEYVCLETEETVLREKKTCLFDERVKSKYGLRQFKTYKSPIFGDDGEPIGTVGVAHDVTDLENMGTELEIILRSMPFSILVVDDRGKILNVNARFEAYFGIAQEKISGLSYEAWKRQTLQNQSRKEENGVIGLSVVIDGVSRQLELREEPIYDIFMDKVGRLCLFRDVTVEQAMEQQIVKSANTDFLTGLNNRRYFYNYINQYRGENSVSLVYVDLDGFKDLNDLYGHQAGDEALVITARLLRKCFPDDTLVRLGGDEFLILILGACAPARLVETSERLLREIVDCFSVRDTYRDLTASIGIAQTDDSEFGIDALLRQSDLALYEAKREGRNRVKFYKPEMETVRNKRL